MQFVNEIFNLNPGDKFLLEQFRSGKLELKTYLNDLDFNKLPFIFKLARHDSKFKDSCEAPDLQNIWLELFIHSSKLIHLSLPDFLPHRVHSHFNLVCGVYLYAKSLELRQLAKDKPSQEELFLLQEASKYLSIHAYQQYLKYIFKQCETDALSMDEQQKIICEQIPRCKYFLNYYGSYAYMILADIFVNYAKIFLKKHDIRMSISIINSAKRCLTLAYEYLDISQDSIFNASFGQGLKTSNEYSIEDPLRATTLLEQWEETFTPSLKYKP